MTTIYNRLASDEGDHGHDHSSGGYTHTHE